MPYSKPPRFDPASFNSGPGAFTPLAALPRRPSATKSIPKATFHFSDDSSPSDDDDSGYPPPLKLKTKGVPFPTNGSPLPSPIPSLAPPAITLSLPSSSPRPSPTRTNSTPILLSNGKPLKSSLKSSSSPNIQAMLPASVPSTPATENGSPATPKNVHFPSASAELETVRVFNRSARPASLSFSGPVGEETETETEPEGSVWGRAGITSRGGWGTWAGAGRGRGSAGASTAFPFPRISSPTPPAPTPPQSSFVFSPQTSTIPRPGATTTTTENVLLQSISLLPGDESRLEGSIRVRNLSYEKHVFVRFTLDEWMTTSEVSGRYSYSLPPPPSSPLPSPSLPPSHPSAIKPPNPGDDIFAFSITLPPPHILTSKTLWMVVRYLVPGTGEFWDNNGGGNYRVGFVRSSAVFSSNFDATTTATGGLKVPQRPTRMERSLSEGDSRVRPYGVSSYAAPAPPLGTYTSSSSTFPQPPAPPSSSSTSATTGAEPEPQGSFATGAPRHHTDSPPLDKAAVQNATEKRLRGFSLTNYARPSAPIPVPGMASVKRDVATPAPAPVPVAAPAPVHAKTEVPKAEVEAKPSEEKEESLSSIPFPTSSPPLTQLTPSRMDIGPLSPLAIEITSLSFGALGSGSPSHSPIHTPPVFSTPGASEKELKKKSDTPSPSLNPNPNLGSESVKGSKGLKITTTNLPSQPPPPPSHHNHQHQPALSPTIPSRLVRSIGRLPEERVRVRGVDRDIDDHHHHHHVAGAEDEKEKEQETEFPVSRESSSSSVSTATSTDDSDSLFGSSSLTLTAPPRSHPHLHQQAEVEEEEEEEDLPPLDRSLDEDPSSDESELDSLDRSGRFGGLFTLPTAATTHMRRHHRHSMLDSVSLKPYLTPLPNSDSNSDSNSNSPAPSSPISISPKTISSATANTPADSDSLYKAFVRQWCFTTTSPTSSPTAVPMSASGTSTPGVGLGVRGRG